MQVSYGNHSCFVLNDRKNGEKKLEEKKRGKKCNFTYLEEQRKLAKRRKNPWASLIKVFFTQLIRKLR